MKRDNDYMIELLKKFEEDKSGMFYRPADGPNLKLWHHLDLLCDEGFIKKVGEHGFFRLTNQGHDFLDKIDKSGLEKIKEKLKEKGLEYTSVPLKMISSLGSKIIESKLGLQ